MERNPGENTTPPPPQTPDVPPAIPPADTTTAPPTAAPAAPIAPAAPVGGGVTTGQGLSADFSGDQAAMQAAGITPVQVTPGESNQQVMQAVMAAYGANPALQQYLLNNIPYAAWMLNNSELAPILITSAVMGWDQGEMSAAVSQTNWWKQNGSTVSNWLILQQTDPAEANNQIALTKNVVLTQAQAIGVTLNDAQLTAEATNYLMFGWNQETLDQDLRQNWYAKITQGQQTPPSFGTASDFYDQAKQLLSSYYVPVSDPTLLQWTQKAVQGQATISGFEQYLRTQAASLYPFMATALAQGMTPKDYLSPYSEQAATVLGISPTAINWNDPKWMQAITQVNADGSRQAKNLYQFTTDIKSDPQYGYQYTQDAHNQAFAVADSILHTFGKIAG